MDLNADVGEGFDDGALLACVTSVNLACGFHAGDAATMQRTVRAAAAAGLAIGAHPGYPDREGFGRRDLHRPAGQIEAEVLYQIGALAAFVRAEGGEVSHVKPHGALYHRAASDEAVAAAVASAAARAKVAVLVGPIGSDAMQRAAAAVGLRFAAEAFADRRADAAGRLFPRDHADALITGAEEAAAQAVRLAREGRADTLGLHGDTPGSASLARAVRSALDAAGIRVAALRA